MKKLMLTFLVLSVCAVSVVSQSRQIPLIGADAPQFTANSTAGELTFPNDFGDGWKILLSHPRDFTPVCSSEILELANLRSEFKDLGVKLAVISTDELSQHKMWKAHLEELNYKNRGQQTIDFPLFADPDGKYSRRYGMIHEATSTTRNVRGVFILDSKNIVRSINFYPMQVGRNMDELVRIVEALKKTDQEQVLLPANWKDGDDVLMPYHPYTKAQLDENPELKKKYYNVGNRMWFKVEGGLKAQLSE